MLDALEIKNLCEAAGEVLAVQLHNKIAAKVETICKHAEEVQRSAEIATQTAKTELAGIETRVDAIKATRADGERKAKELQAEIDSLTAERDQLLPVVKTLRDEVTKIQQKFHEILS